MTKQFEMLAGGNLPKFIQISRSPFIRINYAYCKTICEFFLHHFGYLIAAFLMVATTWTNQSFHKVGVNVTLRYYEIRALIHLSRYASRL